MPTTPNEKVQCEVCFKLLHPRGVKRHLSEVHGEKKELQCDLCNRIFKNKSSLDTHKRVVHNIAKPSQYF